MTAEEVLAARELFEEFDRRYWEIVSDEGLSDGQEDMEMAELREWLCREEARRGVSITVLDARVTASAGGALEISGRSSTSE